MGKVPGNVHPSSHARSYIPNTMFLWQIIQLLMTIKPTHKILSITHRKCQGKSNIWIVPPLLQKSKYGRSQLYRDQIFSHTICLYNRKFDWCLMIDPYVQTDRQTDRHTYRQTDRHTYIHTYIHTDIQTYIACMHNYITLFDNAG